MKLGCIIQARFSSTRLPGKVLKELPYGSGITVLEQVVRRASRVVGLDDIVIATSNTPQDDGICLLAGKMGIKHFRGSLDDVLGRYYSAAKKNGYEHILRITSDCPCLDWGLLNNLKEVYFRKKYDYAVFPIENNVPRGAGGEFFKFDLLEDAYTLASDRYDREHVTSYFYGTARDKYRIGEIKIDSYHQHSDARLTLDTAADYLLMCALYDYLRRDFNLLDIFDLFDKKPWIKEINSHVRQKRKFDSPEAEIQSAVALLKQQEMYHAAAIIEEKGI